MKKTGRIFKCVGLEEKFNLFWNKDFEINILYYELEDNNKKVNKHTLFLKDEIIDTGWYVDKDQFELHEPN